MIQQIEQVQAASKDEREKLNERIRDMERQMDAMLSHNKYEQMGIEGLNTRMQDMNNYINHIKKHNSELQHTVDTLQTALKEEKNQLKKQH